MSPAVFLAHASSIRRHCRLSLPSKLALCPASGLPKFAPASGTQKKNKTSLWLYLLCHQSLSAFEDNFSYHHFHPCKTWCRRDGSVVLGPLFSLYFAATALHASVSLSHR